MADISARIDVGVELETAGRITKAEIIRYEFPREFILFLFALSPYSLPQNELIIATKSSTISLSGVFSSNLCKDCTFTPNSDKYVFIYM